MGVAVRCGPRNKILDRFYLYSEYLLHYILKIGGMVLVAFLYEETHFSTAASGSKSRTDGPSSEIPLRSSRVSPPREECESFFILFWADYALSLLSSGDRKNQYDFKRVESIFEITFVGFLC